jgi:DNA topoisomerase-1
LFCICYKSSGGAFQLVQKYLGDDYEVLASYGHVRDLPARKGSVDPDHNFAMTYAPLEKNSRHIETIAKSLKKADSLLLATDPDREGEAIFLSS